jgi:tetratricopeptide (TPR) repeat protein
MSQALVQYQKGIEVNATNPLCYVGLGKVQWYEGKQTEAKANFYKATTLAQGKNATVLMKIADAYINADNKNISEALSLLALADKLEPKNPEVFILMGDAYLEQNDGTNAITNYEKAGALDPKSVKAILRQGQLWNRSRNFTKALEFYKKASDVDSNFAPAYREKAEIYHRAGQEKNAAAQYKKYLQLNNDCSARGRYAGFLNQAKMYQESLDAVNEAIKCNPKNPYLYRYKAYDQYELGDFANGYITDSTFFAKADSSVKIITQDNEYKAKYLSKKGKDSLAIIEFKKLLVLQPEKIEYNGDIAKCYYNLKKYVDAIIYYKIKIEKGKSNVNDSLALGRCYYFSKDFINADTTFAMVIKNRPTLSVGYLWRAKSNIQMDLKNENWLAKPFYEQYMPIAEKEGVDKNKKDLIDAYTYMGVYFNTKKEICKAKEYFKKVFDLDANNVNAKKFLDSEGAKKCQ